MQDWYLFKEPYKWNKENKDKTIHDIIKRNQDEFEYLGFMNYTVTTKERNKRLKDLCAKHKNCYIWVMKVVKGVQN